jgi:hypothetical protein
VKQYLQVVESIGFPGVIGSIYCMHGQREKCSLAWRAKFICGGKGVLTMILKEVPSKDLRI